MKKLPLWALPFICLTLPLTAARGYIVPLYDSHTDDLIEQFSVSKYMEAFDCQEEACINEQTMYKERGKMVCCGYIRRFEGSQRIKLPYVLKGLIFRFFNSLPPCKAHGRVLLFQTLDCLLRTSYPKTKELCEQKLKEVIKRHNVAFPREDERSKSMLHYLCKKHDCLPLFNQCLASGVEVNMVDEAGLSPLLTAILHENKAAIKPLIEYGANINKKIEPKSGEGAFPLYLACEKIHLETYREIALELLTYESLDVNLTYHGKNALFVLLEKAKENKYVDVIKAFLARKELDLTFSYNGMTALGYAQKKNLVNIIPLLSQ